MKPAEAMACKCAVSMVTLLLTPALAIRPQNTEIIQIQQSDHSQGFAVLDETKQSEKEESHEEKSGPNSTAFKATADSSSPGNEDHDEHESKVHSDTQLESLEEATAEQLEEILSMAIQKAKETDNLSRIREAAKDASGDFSNPMRLVVGVLRHSLPEILSAKGFEAVPIEAFLDHIHRLVAKGDDRFSKHIAEVQQILSQGTVSEMKTGSIDFARFGHEKSHLNAEEKEQLQKERDAQFVDGKKPDEVDNDDSAW